MALELNHYELNILMSALGALETSVLHELAELRRVSELVNAEYHKPTDAFVASQEELYDNDFMVVS